jgi:hypothetical protein
VRLSFAWAALTLHPADGVAATDNNLIERQLESSSSAGTVLPLQRDH